MNPMLQRHCAKYIYIVPDGLRELMSDISREVIRSKPEQIYTFVADYLDALMITRENARISAKLVESIAEIAEVTVSLLVRIGINRDEADQIASIIQAHFRAYLARKKKGLHADDSEEEMDETELFTQKILNECHIDREKMTDMAKIIQDAYRKFKERQQREKQLLFGMVDWRIAARSAIRLYRRTGVTYFEANRAATLIKAAYKGYYTRRIMRRLLEKGLEAEEAPIEETESYESISQKFEEEEETYPSTYPTSYPLTTEEEEEMGSEEDEGIYEKGIPLISEGEKMLTMDMEQSLLMEEEPASLFVGYEQIGEGEEVHFEEHVVDEGAVPTEEGLTEEDNITTELDAETEPLTMDDEITETTDA